MMISHPTCMIEDDKWWHNVWRWNESERAMMLNWLHFWLWQFQVSDILLLSKAIPSLLCRRGQQSNSSLSITSKYFAWIFYARDNFQINKFLSSLAFFRSSPLLQLENHFLFFLFGMISCTMRVKFISTKYWSHFPFFMATFSLRHQHQRGTLMLIKHG